eukprot:Hpha_TRINITY_DN29786_c0_g1::TRINITY_DN29786_c0_g1_i1::g.2709::m.2709
MDGLLGRGVYYLRSGMRGHGGSLRAWHQPPSTGHQPAAPCRFGGGTARHSRGLHLHRCRDYLRNGDAIVTCCRHTPPNTRPLLLSRSLCSTRGRESIKY